MSRKRRLALMAAFVVACAGTLLAAPMTIRLATQAPANSSYHRALLDMGDKWAKSTADRVKLLVFAGGTQGDELTTIRMMRPGVDQLQAGFLMVAGLSKIDEAFNVFGIPFFFQSDEEELRVQERLTPELEKRLQQKGFHLLCWGNGGWVQLFSKKPLKTLDEIKQAKLFTSQGDDRMVQWYKANGFHPVPLNVNDIPAQLKIANGMIDATPSPPYPALMLQIFRDAKFMLDVHVAPLVGALVITNEAWGKISPEDRVKLTEAAKGLEKQVVADAPKQDAESVSAMQARGLTVIKMDAAASAQLRSEAEKLAGSMRGGMVPADIYDMAVKERDAFRKGKGH